MRECSERARSSRRRGSALLFSVLALVVVSILAAGFLQLALSVTKRLNTSADTHQALNLAEAGLAEAYTGLGVAHTGNVGSEAAPAVFGGGLFWVEASEQGGGLVELKSTGMYGTGRATLGLVCEPVSVGVGSLGFFTLQSLKLNPNSLIDSYDSSKGSYPEQVNTALNNQGVVGSNADVAIAGDDKVYGDVVPGPTGKASLGLNAIVTGHTSSRPELEVMSDIEVPDVPLAKATVHSGAVPLILPPGESGYASLEIGKNAKLVLKGPLKLVTGTLRLRSGASMALDTSGGPIEVYISDTLDLNTSSTVSTSSQVTADSAIYVTAPAGKTVSFGAKSQFYGFIYAPKADVHVAAQFEVYGGLVANSMQLAAQGRMHYDLALGSVVQERLPILRAWRVVDIPHEVAAKRIDPFHVLGVDPAALRSPADAHEDQTLEVRYVGSDGNTHTYNGPESAFDWSLVAQVLYGLRDGLAFVLSDSPPPDPAQHSPLLDLVNSSMSSKNLRDALLAAAPVPSEVLVAACQRTPSMTKSDLKNVLVAQPLDDAALTAAIGSAALDSSSLKSVLIGNSPLSAGVLAAVLARIPPLSLSDLLNVLAAQ